MHRHIAQLLLMVPLAFAGESGTAPSELSRVHPAAADAAASRGVAYRAAERLASQAQPRAGGAGGHSHGDGAAGHSHGADGLAPPTAAGRPGRASEVTRTIRVEARDIAFDARSLEVRVGETVRFVVTNVGRIPHEFAVGTREEQATHREMMARMPNMAHDDPNVVSLEPGETKALIWQFTERGEVEFACNIPGHAEAGMRGEVKVVGRAVKGTGATTPDANQ